MKLVFQIAAGIIIASGIMFIGSTAIGLLAVKDMQKANEERIREAQVKREILKKEQDIRNKQAIEEARIRNIMLNRELKAKAERKTKIRKAWNEFYEIPYQCKYQDSDSIRKWCSHYKANAKKEFNEKVRSGNIKIL